MELQAPVVKGDHGIICKINETCAILHWFHILYITSECNTIIELSQTF